jgi:transposase
VSDEEWAFCAPYLTLMKEAAPQREHSLRELYNGLRWFVRAGCPWRMLPNDLPPWPAVQQQTQRWLRAGCFETMAEDLRALLRLAAQRDSVPTAVILDSRTLQSTPESGGRAGYDGARRNAKAARSMQPWTHWDICWRSKSLPPANRIGRRSKTSRKPCKQPRERTYNWRMWIKATPARSRRWTRHNTECNWKW